MTLHVLMRSVGTRGCDPDLWFQNLVTCGEVTHEHYHTITLTGDTKLIVKLLILACCQPWLGILAAFDNLVEPL